MANEIGKKLLSALDKAVNPPVDFARQVQDVTDAVDFHLSSDEENSLKDSQKICDRIKDEVYKHTHPEALKVWTRKMEEFRAAIISGEPVEPPSTFEDFARAFELRMEGAKSAGAMHAENYLPTVKAVLKRWLSDAEKLAKNVESQRDVLGKFLGRESNLAAAKNIREIAAGMRHRAETLRPQFGSSPRSLLAGIAKI